MDIKDQYLSKILTNPTGYPSLINSASKYFIDYALVSHRDLMSNPSKIPSLSNLTTQLKEVGLPKLIRLETQQLARDLTLHLLATRNR